MLKKKKKKLYNRSKDKKRVGGWPLPRSGVPKSKKSRIRLIDFIDNAALDGPSSSEWFAVLSNCVCRASRFWG